jgi:hypothetical protein
MVVCEYGYRWFQRGPARATREEAEEDENRLTDLQLLLALCREKLSADKQNKNLIIRITKALHDSTPGSKKQSERPVADRPGGTGV